MHTQGSEDGGALLITLAVISVVLFLVAYAQVKLSEIWSDGRFPRIIANSSGPRILLEAAALEFAVSLSWVLYVRLEVLSDEQTLLHFLAGLLRLGIVLVVNALVIPTWLALRLEKQTKPKRFVFLALGVWSITVVVFTLSHLVLRPDPFFSLLLESIAFALIPSGFFVLFRLVVLLVNSIRKRDYAGKLCITPSYTLYKAIYFLGFLILAMILVWLFTVLSFFNQPSQMEQPSHPVPTTFPPGPIDAVTFFSKSLPTVLILLIGFLVVHLRLDEETALVFVVLCLLLGVWGHDFYRDWETFKILWYAHLFGWFMLPTVLMHFALIFPHWEEVVPRRARQETRQLISVMYISFAVVAPGIFWVHLEAYEAQSLAELRQWRAGLPLAKGLLFQFLAYWLVINMPLALIMTLYALRDTERKASSITILESSGCKWVDTVQQRRQELVRTRLESVPNQLKILKWGALVSIALVVTWLTIGLAFSSSLDFLGRTGFLVFCGSVLFSLYRHRLWDISRNSLLVLLCTPIILPLSPTVVYLANKLLELNLPNWLKTVFSSAGIQTFLIVMVLLAVSPMLRLLDKRIRRTSLGRRHRWRQSVQAISADLEDEDYLYSLSALKEVLDRACPPGVTAQWLLRPFGEDRFTIHSISHSHGGKLIADCHDLLRSCLAEAGESRSRIRLRQDLARRCRIAVEDKRKRIISTLESPLRMTLDRRLWEQLRKFRIPLIIPVGASSNNVAGVKALWIIGTDSFGDTYREEDLQCLFILAADLGKWLGK